MKLPILSLLLLALPALSGTAVTNLVLNPNLVVVVPVATDRLSTIRFPSPPTHLEAAFVSLDAEPPARFQLAFQPGQSFFSVRALSTNFTASVNVMWRTNTYAFELVPSAEPTLSLNLVEPVRRDVRVAKSAPGTHRLLGILDTAKAFPLLRTQQPAEVGDIEHVTKAVRFDFDDYELLLEEVFRFRTEDALVFRVVLVNKTGALLRYLPQSFRVRVGEKTFPAAISDGDGTLPAYSRSTVYFAVATGEDGTRPALAIANDFVVLVTVPAPMRKPSPKPQNGAALLLIR